MLAVKCCELLLVHAAWLQWDLWGFCVLGETADTIIQKSTIVGLVNGVGADLTIILCIHTKIKGIIISVCNVFIFNLKNNKLDRSILHIWYNINSLSSA